MRSILEKPQIDRGQNKMLCLHNNVQKKCLVKKIEVPCNCKNLAEKIIFLMEIHRNLKHRFYSD